MQTNTTHLLIPLITTTVILVDQMTKWIVNLGYSHEFFGISIYAVENPYLGFGLRWTASAPWLTPIIACLGCLFLLHFISVQKSPQMSLAGAFIIGGAFSNNLDRLFQAIFQGYGRLGEGRVTDFIHLEGFQQAFSLEIGQKAYAISAFNLADLCILSGSAFLILLHLNLLKVKSQDLKQPSTPTGNPNKKLKTSIVE